MSVQTSRFPYILLCGLFVCGTSAPIPLINRRIMNANVTVESRMMHWETLLYAGSLARGGSIPWEKRGEMTGGGDYLMGIKRIRRLYCNVGIGFHLQVLPDGKIAGVHNENRYSKCVIRKCIC